jgi:CHAT domain-containing protein
MSKAEALLAQKTPTSLHDAQTLYQQALQTWQSLGDASRQVHTLLALATTHFLLNEKDQTAAMLAQAGDIAKASGARADQADVLAGLAQFQIAQSEPQQARESAAKAADIYRELGQSISEANLRMSLGLLDMGSQQATAAAADYQRAAGLYHGVANFRGEALALAGAGRAYSLLNQPEGFEQAVTAFTGSIALLEGGPDAFNLGMALWGLGTANDRLGRKAAARDSYERALPLFTEPRFNNVRAPLLLSLAEDEQALHNLAKAAEYFQQALPLFATPADAASRGLALMGLGNVRESLGDASGALDAYTDAAAAWRAAKDTDLELTTQLKIGAIQLAARNWQAALDADNAALKIGQDAQDDFGEARAFESLSSVYLARGNHRRSLDDAEQAIARLDPVAHPFERSVTLGVAGLAASHLHQNAKALGYLQEMVELGDRNPVGRAGSWTTQAGIYTQLGEPKKALALLEQARTFYAEQHDEAMLGKLANDFGLAYAAEGRKTDAQKSYETALAAAIRRGDPQQQGAILSNLAQLRLDSGDANGAAGDFERARIKAQESGDRNTEAIILDSLGMAYHAGADEADAAKTLAAALALHRDLGDPHGAAVSLNNFGLFYSETGELQKALDAYEEALKTLQQAPDRDPENEAVTLGNIGVLYRGLGANDLALGYNEQALSIFAETGDEEGRATRLNDRAVIKESQGDPRAALEDYQQALDIVERLGKRARQASLLSAMGVAHSDLNEHAEAIEFLNRSLAIAVEIGSQPDEALARHNLGTEYELSGKLVEALDQLRQAQSLWRETGNVEFEAISWRVIARIEMVQQMPEAALRDVERSIDLSETVRGRLGSEDLRASLLARATSAYELKIEILMQLSRLNPKGDDAARALETSERGRARSLLDLIAQSHAAIGRGVDPALLNRQREIRHALSAKALLQAKLAQVTPKPPDLDELRRQIDELTAAYEQSEAAIRVASPGFANLTQALTAPQIQALLDPNTLLLEYSFGKERSYMWAVTPGAVHSYELPARAVILNAVRDFQNAIPEEANPQSFERASAVLGAILLGPAAGELGHKRLVVVGDAALQAAVPFAALATPGREQGAIRPLAMDHEILQEPSASAVAALRAATRGRAPPAGLVAVLADPVVSADDPRLLVDKKPRAARSDRVVQVVSRAVRGAGLLKRLGSTGDEARSILALAPPALALSRFGFEATKAAAEDPELGHYRIVHFATHGWLDARNPNLSGLVLSLFKPDGTEDDGFLRLPDVFNLDLPVDLVVLSACESGQGQTVAGEGLVGLTRGFIYAGAARLVVSLWDVDDKATAVLMKDFYGRMLGSEHLRPAEALRRAQIDMLSNGAWKSPRYWAPFIAQGEWHRGAVPPRGDRPESALPRVKRLSRSR